MKTKTPIIQELNYSDSDKAEVKRIQADKIFTNKKDRMRAALGGCSLCCICHVTVPTKRVEYSSGRVETYCDEHFSIYERTLGIDIHTIAETYNCTIVTGTGTFGKGKKEYEQ